MKKMNNKPLAPQVIAQAHDLFESGLSLTKISERLNVSTGALSKYKTSQEWDKDIMPSFTIEDIILDLMVIIFRYVKAIRRGERDEDTRETFLNIKNFSSALKDLIDLSDAIGVKSAIVESEKLMEWIKDEKPMTEQVLFTLDLIQEYHDRTQSEVI